MSSPNLVPTPDSYIVTKDHRKTPNEPAKRKEYVRQETHG